MTLRTTSGRVRGRRHAGIASFLGIPYAAEPFGAFRFRAPGPPPRWDGVRDALTHGPTAPQSGTQRLPGIDLAPLLGGWTRGDDCLTVNVWTPDPDTAGLPVMIFLHGGSFVAGAGSLPVYDGARFAARGVVLVTVNYRLGAEGFLPLPGGDANAGLRDQIAALRWVQQNIAAFGGDPAQVTVFGESAGAISIACLMASPAAAGLFARAILQSGNTSVRSAGFGPRLANALAGLLGAAPTRQSFARLDPADLVDAQVRLARDPGVIDLSGLRERAGAVTLVQFLPALDGEIVPVPVLDAVDAGAAAGIDVLGGTNTDEMNLWLVPTGVVAATTQESLEQRLAAQQGADPAAVIGAYRRAHPDATPGQLYSAIATDRTFRGPTLKLLDRHTAAGGRAFAFEFTEPSPALGGGLGACHLVELPYVFGNLRADGLGGSSGLSGDEPSETLSARVQEAWVRFAAHGDPGWAPYTAHERSVMRIGAAAWTLAPAVLP